MNRLGIILLVVLAGCAGSRPAALTPEGARQAASDYLRGCVNAEAGCGYPLDPGTDVDTVLVHGGGVLEIRLNDAYAQEPVREAPVAALRDALSDLLPGDSLLVTSLGVPIGELVPNHERSATARDRSRLPVEVPAPRPILRFPDRSPLPTRGLAGRHVALWGSHGWYYEQRLERWEWQRARLFSTVEDVLPTSFILPYLAPMLERAGAHVWMPRERDPQPNMVILDDAAAAQTCDWDSVTPGFAPGDLVFGEDDRPWDDGTHLVRSAGDGSCGLAWEGRLPEPGPYALYVSYGRHENATSAARYTVHHAGGATRFEVDQSMAGGTWVYAGTFEFDGEARILLDDAAPAGTVVSADAVRLGGGMGVIERGGSTSGRPRWLEGARYALQFDGMPAALVYNITEQSFSDYVDDYRNRGEWVNYLRGAPLGPNKDPGNAGMGVPVDVSLAFHTDAGITQNDTTIGTLAIYSSRGFGPDGEEARIYQDGVSRFANRDLADLVQSQIVADLRALYDSTWTRRSIWDRDYSEAYRPNVPSMLLELLSHQNFADMRFALDPRFRFDVSRAIYKAVLRYVAWRYDEPDPTVAPLAPDGLTVTTLPDGRVRASWRAVPDPLEPSARPESYRVYRRYGTGGFDDGVPVTETEFVFAPDSGVVSVRVTGVNAGGESAPSEVLAGLPSTEGRVLVVSAFDRVGPPAALDHPGWRGFADFLDHGVADRVDLSFVGAQHEFDPGEPWEDDDDPGHGASHADWETRTEPGNTFDYAAGIGLDFVMSGAAAGFDSVSDEVFAAGIDLDGYDLIYVLVGEERASVSGHPRRPEYEVFSAGFKEALVAAREAGKHLVVSGSYVTEEIEDDFGGDVLGVRHRTPRASRTGAVRGVAGAFDGLAGRFNTRRGGAVYAAEAPEAIEPAVPGARTVLRYGDSNMSAAVAAPGSVTFGFPLETVVDPAARRALIRAALAELASL